MCACVRACVRLLLGFSLLFVFSWYTKYVSANPPAHEPNPQHPTQRCAAKLFQAPALFHVQWPTQRTFSVLRALRPAGDPEAVPAAWCHAVAPGRLVPPPHGIQLRLLGATRQPQAHAVIVGVVFFVVFFVCAVSTPTVVIVAPLPADAGP